MYLYFENQIKVYWKNNIHNNMLSLKEGLDSFDNKKIISSLIKLRKSSKVGQINTKTFELLVELIKLPNEKILNYALSLLANSCLRESHRRLFKDLGGVHHLMIIINSINNNSILSRACRLLGNLSSNTDVANDLHASGAGLSLIKLLEKYEVLSHDALTMAFRALKKIWTLAQHKWTVSPGELTTLFSICLNSGDEQVIRLAVETLVPITYCKNVPRKNKIQISKEFLMKLIELSRNEDLRDSVITCLSNVICYQTSTVWKFLEGSKIAEVFIDHMQNVNDINEGIYKAFYKLCTEGGIRSKVRLSGLLMRLIDTCSLRNVKIILAIFTLFQYDLDSMKTCSLNPKFTSLLIDNIKHPGSIQLLAVLSRLNPPAKDLVVHNNLDVLLDCKECNGILKNIVRTTEFLKPIILSGKVWRLEKAGCKMEDICLPGYIEFLLTQLLSLDDRKCREEVSLAAPFLIKASNFPLLYKVLSQYRAMETILRLLRENSTEERVSSTVVRLINIFRSNYHSPDGFFQDFAGGKDSLSLESNEEHLPGRIDCQAVDHSELSETVEFEFDDGDTLIADKTLICLKSDVLNSMLNGHFSEATQDKIRMRNCRKKSFVLLINYLSGEIDFTQLDVETYLELLSLSDRFLISKLNSELADNFKMDAQSCSVTYKWYRQAGHTANNRKVGQKLYEFIFSAAENLYATMKDETSRIPLVNEISQYLSDTLRDLSD